MRTPLGRVTATAVSTVLITSGALVAATPAQAAPTDVAADAGAGWLASQLVDGLLPGQFGGGDVGLSIDAAMSLAEVGGQDAAVADIAAAVQGTAGKDYIAFEGFGYVGKAANATGKALAFFQSLDTPPTAIQGIDVLQRMEELTLDTGDSTGRIVDQNTQDGEPADDFANSLGQAFAARGLAAAGSDEAAAAVEYLLFQQCPAGGFRLDMAEATATSGLTCTDDAEATNDVTGIVLLQLIASGSQDPDVTQAVADGIAWLEQRQEADGSWGGSGAETASNSNSTALAARAVGGSAAQQAAAWLRTLQATATHACGPLAGDLGALAYDPSAFSTGRSRGIEASARDQWQRVMAQSLPALAFLDEADAAVTPQLFATGSGYRKAGSQVEVCVAGTADGEQARLSGPGADQTFTATGPSAQRTLTMPAGTANRVYTATVGGQSATATLRVLGSKTLPVSASKARAQRGSFVTATVRGLASGESVTVRYRGNVVKRGKATGSGTFSARFRVGQSLGVKGIGAQGEFTDIRRGQDTVRVVR